MKTFIIAAVTADGFIAKNSAHSPLLWRSKADREFFIQKSKEAGVVAMGLNSAKASKKPMPGRLNIIYANSKDDLLHWKDYGEWEVTQKDPSLLLQELQERGYHTLAICGGATIYTMFMEAKVVHKLYLTVEPWIFGQGLHLFKKDFEQKLELASVRQVDQSVFVEYNVIN